MPAVLPTFSREREREVPSNNGYLLVITAARTTKVKTASVTDCCHLPIQKTGVFNGHWPTKLSILFSFSVVKTTKLKQHARYLLFFLMPPANSKNWSFQWPLANETQHFVQLLCCQDNEVKTACALPTVFPDATCQFKKLEFSMAIGQRNSAFCSASLLSRQRS